MFYEVTVRQLRIEHAQVRGKIRPSNTESSHKCSKRTVCKIQCNSFFKLALY